MTKAEIREAYNNLTPVLQSKIDNYKAVTGSYYKDVNMAGNMTPAALSGYKDELEWRLIRRENFIAAVEEATQRALADQAYMTTPEGKAFMERMTLKKAELNEQKAVQMDAIADAFNEYLSAIGLDGWKVKYFPTELDRGTDVCKGEARIRVNIGRNADGSLFIEPSSGLLCGYTKDKMGSGNMENLQYLQFKACCLIVEHAVEAKEFIHTWCETKKTVTDLEYNLNKVSEWMENPSEYGK